MSNNTKVLDTETTGFSTEVDRLIEIGISSFNPENGEFLGDPLHLYINPERSVPAEAVKVHGITDEQLADKPLFKDVAGAIADCVRGAKLVIHNAPFDVRFLTMEFAKCGMGEFTSLPSEILCTRQLARTVRPTNRSASLSALCEDYGIDLSARTLHGALIDCFLLAQVYPHLMRLKIARDADLAVLLPFRPDAQLPQNIEELGNGYAAIEAVVKHLKAEQKRIEKVVAELQDGKDHEDRDFRVRYKPQQTTDWKKITEAYLEGVDLEPYQNRTKGWIEIKPRRLPELVAVVHLAKLMPFAEGELPREVPLLCKGYMALEALVGQLKKEEDRIKKAVDQLRAGAPYESAGFVVNYRAGQLRTDWEKVTAEHLSGVDLKPYQKTGKPEMQIGLKAA